MADELIDGHLSVKQCKRAVTALLEYALKQQQKREENQLLPGKEEFIWLQVSVKRVHAEAKLKPRRMCVDLQLCISSRLYYSSPVKHPLVDPRDSAVCLITKDPQREYKDLLEQAGVKFISRVVGVEKLKGKFKPFEARRALLRENELFLADDRVIPLLPRLLGKIFFTAKKYVVRNEYEGDRLISPSVDSRSQCASLGRISRPNWNVLFRLRTCIKTAGPARLAIPLFFSGLFSLTACFLVPSNLVPSPNPPIRFSQTSRLRFLR